MACVEFGKVISPYKGELELIESSDKEKKKKKKVKKKETLEKDREVKRIKAIQQQQFIRRTSRV